MKYLICILTSLILVSCNNVQKPKNDNSDTSTATNSNSVGKEDRQIIQYSDRQLEAFLDSIGKLPTGNLMDKVAFRSDSIFKNQIIIDKVIPSIEFNKLKQAIKKGELDIKTAKLIFGNFKIDSSYEANGMLPIVLFSFDKNKYDFNEFAICLGSTEAGEYGWSCELYFLNSDRIIAKHSIYHRYGLELEHYKDSDGKTIIYYKVNYQSGSGIWWFNFNFYKYFENKLIPILNELENANLQPDWGYRVLWFETFIQKTNPLTIKMVYYQQLPDTTYPDSRPRIIDDSTFVQYNWNEHTKTLQGQYEKSKINKPQILSYYLEENELLFINAYYKTLKKSLLNKTNRNPTLNYLNEIKNRYDNN